MTGIHFNDQMYFLPDSMVVWMKFYLLSDSDFKTAFPEEFVQMNKEFFGSYSIGGGGLRGNGFYLERFLNDANIDRFADVISGVLNTHAFRIEEIHAMAAACDAFRLYDRQKVDRFMMENLFNDNWENYSLKVHFERLLRALRNRSFYDLSNIRIEQLAGEWNSVTETGALDFNYNMTDFMALGNRVRLIVRPFDEEFHEFICLVSVADYTTKSELDLAVHASYVKMEEGYLHHYYKDREKGFYFSHKRPVYDFHPDSFKTQVREVGYGFEKMDK